MFGNSEKKGSFFERLKEGLSKTKQSLVRNVDQMLFGEKKIDRDLFEDLEETDSGWVWSRDVVTLRPPNRWHMEGVGNRRDVTADYLLTSLPDGRTRLELVWWRQPKPPGKRIPRAQREKETRRAWKRFAAAMEQDYAREKGGRA